MTRALLPHPPTWPPLSPAVSSSSDFSTSDGELFPSDAQLVLLCLDYLRDLRRTYSKFYLEKEENLNADYLSLAIYALSRAFTKESVLDKNNDAHFCIPESQVMVKSLQEEEVSTMDETMTSRTSRTTTRNSHHNNILLSLPDTLEAINREILVSNEKQEGEDDDDEEENENGEKEEEKPQKEDDTTDPYPYNDFHVSNGSRFFGLNGLANGPPLSLAEISAVGLTGLGAKSRQSAEEEMEQDALFEQFLTAVQQKGFFKDLQQQEQQNQEEITDEDRLYQQARMEHLYQERYRKVVAKFRTKLANKASSEEQEQQDYFVTSISERYQLYRQQRIQQCQQMMLEQQQANNSVASPKTANSSEYDSSKSVVTPLNQKLAPQPRALSPSSEEDSPSPPLKQKQQKEDEPAPTMPGTAQQHRSTAAASPTPQQRAFSPKLKRTASSSPKPQQQRAFSPKLLRTASSPKPPNRSSTTASPLKPQQQHATVPTTTAAATTTAASVSNATTTTTTTAKLVHPVDELEAEKCKARGNAYMQQKQYSKAAQAYTRALELSPSGPNSHVYYSNRAAAHLSQKNVEEAVLDSERSLSLKPNYAKAHARLGLSHFLLGNYKNAIAAYTLSLKYDPHNESSQKYLEKAKRRVASSKKQQFHLTDSSNDEVVLKEREAEKHKVKGNSYMASRNYAAALESYSVAISLSPEGPSSHAYYSNRAAALCYLEQYSKAQDDSLKSLKLQPKYGKAHSRLGLSRFFMGDYQGAVEAYQLSLQYDPDNAASKSYLKKAKERLAQQLYEEERSRSSRCSTPHSRSSSRGHSRSSSRGRSRRELVEHRSSASRTKERPSSRQSNSRKEDYASTQDLLHNPDIQRLAKNAMADPSMLDAMLSLQKEK